jgi:hypothetical protein
MQETPTTEPVNWTYKIRKTKQLIRSQLKTPQGELVWEDGLPKMKTFVMFRYRLILHSEKYGAVIEYNVNKPNKAKVVPFFTNRASKKQYLPGAMRKHLVGRFTATEAKQIVEECIEALGL